MAKRGVRRLSFIVGPMVLAVVSMGAVGCGTSTDDKPDKTGTDGAPVGGTTGTEKQPEQTQPEQKQPEQKQAKLGDAITIHTTSNAALRVKVHGVVDPVSPGQSESTPRGKRYIGIQVSVANGGPFPFVAFSKHVQLIDNHGARARFPILLDGNCRSFFATVGWLDQGSRKRGCIPFEIKRGAKPKTFRFAGDPGGPATAEWSLR